MIAYNNTWLKNLYTRAQADEAVREGCIATDVHDAIYKAIEVKFYTPNYFVRIGLAILTLVIISFVAGLFGLIFDVSDSFGFLFGFIGICCFFAVEFLIRSKSHYNSGVDNMLVWMAAFLIWLGVYWIVENPRWYGNNPLSVSNSDTKLSFAALIIFFVLAVRFADVLLSIAATIALLCFTFYSYKHTGVLAKNTTPFFMMLVSGVIYFVTARAMKNRSLLFYRNCLRCMKIVTLFALYSAGNYYLVKELSNEMFHLGLRLQDPLPLGWFFWLWTFLLPFVYIGIGIRCKDVILIRIGIPLIAVAVLTFRYYHSILSPEMAMLLGGLILFAVSYALISYLHSAKKGFTFKLEHYAKIDPLVANVSGELMDGSKNIFLQK